MWSRGSSGALDRGGRSDRFGPPTSATRMSKKRGDEYGGGEPAGRHQFEPVVIVGGPNDAVIAI